MVDADKRRAILAHRAVGQSPRAIARAFTSTISEHGGQETTLLSMYTMFAAWGGVIVPPGFTAPIQSEVGNPYGTSHVSGMDALPPSENHLEGARYQARRITETAAVFKAGRAA